MQDDIIALLVRNRRNRELLDTELAAEYTVSTLSAPTDIRTTEYDLLILDDPALHQSRPQLQERSTATTPIPVPAILLQSPDSPSPQPEVWTHVDDVIHLPADKAALTARIENLLRTRRLAQNYYERA